MRILISNDDGVHSPGIDILAQTLSSLAQVTVVAPDRDRSAASNSLTLDAPLRIRQEQNGYYAVINGTPTDCVHLAITGWLDEHPDMIVSGINNGANLGDDVLYSGTVAAAMEGRFLGYPAIAISLVSKLKECKHFDTAAKVAKYIVGNVMNGGLPKDTILNINVPDIPFAHIQGIKIGRLGHRHLAEQTITSEDPRGNPIYWIGPAGPEQDSGPDTDFNAISLGYVSITPIKTDLTDYEALDRLNSWSKNLDISFK